MLETHNFVLQFGQRAQQLAGLKRFNDKSVGAHGLDFFPLNGDAAKVSEEPQPKSTILKGSNRLQVVNTPCAGKPGLPVPSPAGLAKPGEYEWRTSA